jgi:hypothetical protein
VRAWPATLATTAAVCGALCTGAAASGDSPRVIELVSLTVSASDRGAPPAPGLTPNMTPVRTVTELDRLYNNVPQFGRARQALVGTDRTILVHFRSGRVWISVVTKVPGGTIYVRGELKKGHAPVTGGTGRYANAHGTLEIRNLNAPSLAVNVYRFSG